MAGIDEHLATGDTSVCRAWAVVRPDGQVFGFTDHDTDLEFDGIVFLARSGVTAKALQQSSGLAVDNSEAMGALSHVSLTEADILAGRYDGAEVRAWLVNWAEVSERRLQFRGSLGEIERSGGGFRAELRGLAEALNQPRGRVYQKPCSAVLGDDFCRFNLASPGFNTEVAAEVVVDQTQFRFASLPGFDDRWFEAGRFQVLSGATTGLVGVIKNDRLSADGRMVELWQALGGDVAAGDILRLEAGCDKRADTCRLKFNNFVNFRGFPQVPGEDWLMAYPSRLGLNNGGSLVG